MIVFFDGKTAFLLSVLTNLLKKDSHLLKKIWVEFVGNIATVGLWERRGGGGTAMVLSGWLYIWPHETRVHSSD